MLLQSLDLLDRGLVTRIIQASTSPQAHVRLLDGKSEEKGRKNELFMVRSSQQPSRFKDHGVAKGQIYTVRLQAWNCSCAAFAFSSFPASAFQARVGEGFEGDGKEERDWEFGGFSFDGKGEEGGNVPVCKHLLACVLAERWGDVLGGYVKERVVGREEMGGLGAE
jgi:hypothetical protein